MRSSSFNSLRMARVTLADSGTYKDAAPIARTALQVVALNNVASGIFAAFDGLNGFGRFRRDSFFGTVASD